MLRLLSEENFNGSIMARTVVLLRRPDLALSHIQGVGLAEADDPIILAWAAANHRIVLTHDRTTTPDFSVCPYPDPASGSG